MIEQKKGGVRAGAGQPAGTAVQAPRSCPHRQRRKWFCSGRRIEANGSESRVDIDRQMNSCRSKKSARLAPVYSENVVSEYFNSQYFKNMAIRHNCIKTKYSTRNKCEFWQTEPDAVQGGECAAVRALQAGANAATRRFWQPKTHLFMGEYLNIRNVKRDRNKFTIHSALDKNP